MDIIYQRTLKGNEEITKRTFKLDHFHRFVLIMIDGKATVESIISRSSEQWKPIQCLKTMESQGFIENIDSSITQTPVNSLVQQNLVAIIKKQIPNNNTKVVNKILNSNPSKEDLVKAINSSCVFVKLTISEEIAKQLKLDLHSTLNQSI